MSVQPSALAPALADAFKLSVDGESMIIEFGHGAGHMPNGEPRVAVTDRMVVPLAMVHRLAIQLDDALKPHAAGLRLQQAQALPPAQAAVAARPGAAPARPAPEEAGDRAAELIRQVGALAVPHQYERSFRIAERSLQANRFLLTFNTRDVLGDARARVLEICDRMAMPEAARVMAEARFDMAHCIHFGFEGEADAIVCKLYLERAVSEEEARQARAESRAVLLHLAFKWDVVRRQAVTTRYHWYPALTGAEIETRLAHVYGGTDRPSFDIARAVLRLGQDHVPAERMQYLEVEEAENDRRSFDLNLYNARLQMKDIQPLLTRMREHFSVRPGQFQALYDQVKSLALGHLAGGVHRNGQDFFNLYYGVVALPHFHERFQAAGGTMAS